MSTQAVEMVLVHAEGEIGHVITGGVATPPGDTLWDQSRWIHNDGHLRDLVLNEPRGGIHCHVNLLVPQKDPRAAAGFIIMEPLHTPPMSGSNAMCVATALLETGRVKMIEPETIFWIEAPAGLIEIRAACSKGKAERIRLTNTSCFVSTRDARLEVPGIGTLKVDVAYGGDSYVLVDAAQIRIEDAPLRLTHANAGRLATLGNAITKAANDQIGFSHPTNPGWGHISFCQFTEPTTMEGDALTGLSAVVIDPGRIDRSPCGTGCSARMALLHAQGHLAVGDSYHGHAILGGEFHCRVEEETDLGGLPAIVPSVSGRAWIAGRQTLITDPSDPWPRGYRLSDTWPGAGAG